MFMTGKIRVALLTAAFGSMTMAGTPMAPLYAQAPAAPRALGTVKSISPTSLTVTTKDGADVTVTLSDGVQVVQLPPGSTDLKAGSPAQPADIAIGDRVLVTGKAGDTLPALSAARVVLMKSNDIASRKATQQADWQRNGTGGLVRAIDGTTLTIAAGARTLKVETNPQTIFRRYASDSVSFEDAKPGSLDQVRTGDQISVRGAKSGDGSSITAAEVVTGTFENLSGIVSGIDTTAMTVTLKDLLTKKTVTVQVTSNSDLRKLPAQAAASFATRNGAGGAASAGAGAGRRAGMDLSRMLSRLPTETLAELKTGDAVMIVASQGRADSLTAITMLSGVEQLLSSTAAGAQPLTLSPWTLGVPEGGGGGPQ